MQVNGKGYSFKEGQTISDLLMELNVNEERVVIELDKEIIPKEDFIITKLKENSIIEIISFVGGG